MRAPILANPLAEGQTLQYLISNLKSVPHTLGQIRQIGLDSVLDEVDQFLTEIIN